MEPFVELFGIQTDTLTMDETVDAVRALVETGTPHQHVVLNASKLVQLDRDPDLRRIVQSCDLVNADGASVVWASRILRRPLPERVAGIDLFRASRGGRPRRRRLRVLPRCDRRGRRARSSTCSRAVPGSPDRGLPERLLVRRRGRRGRGAGGSAGLPVPRDPQPGQGALAARASRGARRPVRHGRRRVVRRRGRQGQPGAPTACSGSASSGRGGSARSPAGCGSATWWATAAFVCMTCARGDGWRPPA